jgi:cytochrome c
MNRTFVSRALIGLATTVVASCVGGRRPSPYRSSAEGDEARRGEGVVRDVGCGACHEVPGIRQARGQVGPTLEGFARRSFIAGELPHTRANLVRWVLDPQQIEPRTAMPDLDLTEQQAKDVAAFLDTLD